MDLVLFRHADALNVGEAGIKTDEERPLSDKGKVRAKASARGLKALGLKPDLILSSPLVRARQTAEIVARETGLNGDVEICAAAWATCPTWAFSLPNLSSGFPAWRSRSKRRASAIWRSSIRSIPPGWLTSFPPKSSRGWENDGTSGKGSEGQRDRAGRKGEG